MSTSRPVRNNRRSSLRTNRHGVTAVEFAFAFPILMVFVIGLIEFTRTSMIHHAADNAAYEAARNVIVPGADKTEAVNEATSYLGRVGVSGAQIVVSPTTISDETTEVTVRVSVPLAENTWLPPFLMQGQTIERQCTLMTERVKTIQAQAI